MPLKAAFKKKVISILKRFKLEELLLLINSVFPNISVQQIDDTLERLRLPLTPSTVAYILVEIFEDKSPTIDDCDDTLCFLHLFDAIFHTTNTWCTARLLSIDSELPDKLSDLNKAVARGYRSKALNANVKSVLLENIIWSVVAEKIILKKGGVRMAAPNFFMFKPDSEEPHVLYSPKTMDRDLHLQIYVESLGYRECVLVNYEGCNAVSMLNCIERSQLVERSVVALPQYPTNNKIVVRENNWNDYSHVYERKAYAEQIFSGLSGHWYITVECEELQCEQPMSASTIGDFYSTMEFRTSKNFTVEDMFKHLVTIGATVIPLPNYMLSLSSTPSNIMSVQNTDNLRVSVQ